MKMTKTREALTQHIKPTREAFASVALAEVGHAEDLANMLRTVVEGYWQAGQYADGQDEYRAMVHAAEALLAKVGG